MTAQAHRLADLHRRAFVTDRAWSESEFEDLLAAAGVICIERPDGFILGRVAAGEAEILTLAVHPSHRRRGIARTLVAELAQTALDKGADAIFLEVAEDNAAAIALYETLGFAAVGRRPGYYPRVATEVGGKASVAALVLRKSLRKGLT